MTGMVNARAILSERPIGFSARCMVVCCPRSHFEDDSQGIQALRRGVAPNLG